MALASHYMILCNLLFCCKQYAGDISEKLVKVTYSRVALMKCSIQHSNSELSETLDHLLHERHCHGQIGL